MCQVGRNRAGQALCRNRPRWSAQKAVQQTSSLSLLLQEEGSTMTDEVGRTARVEKGYPRLRLRPPSPPEPEVLKLTCGNGSRCGNRSVAWGMAEAATKCS